MNNDGSATTTSNEIYRRDVFVIMPFSGTASCTTSQWTEVFEEVFVPAVESCGYTCTRAAVSTGSLIKSIIRSLRDAYIVIADITDCNPNVFYELGVRHSLCKRTIVVAQNASHIPSDLRGYWSLIYGTRPREVSAFRENLQRIIAEIERNPERSDSPVSDYLDQEFVSVSRYRQRENIKKLNALCTELSENLLTVQKLKEDKNEPSLVSYGCISHLIETVYLDVGPELLQQLYELRRLLRVLEVGQRPIELLDELLARTEHLIDAVSKMRSKVLTGEYTEPDHATFMLWHPGVNWVCGFCHTSSIHEDWRRTLPISWMARSGRNMPDRKRKSNTESDA